MFLQCVMLPERLLTSLDIACKLFPAFVCGQMSSKPGSCHEALVAAFMLAHVIPDIGVCRLDVPLEVERAQKILVATFMWANEGATICMRTKMLHKFCGTIERLFAVRICTGYRLKTRRPCWGVYRRDRSTRCWCIAFCAVRFHGTGDTGCVR